MYVCVSECFCSIFLSLEKQYNIRLRLESFSCLLRSILNVQGGGVRLNSYTIKNIVNIEHLLLQGSSTAFCYVFRSLCIITEPRYILNY